MIGGLQQRVCLITGSSRGIGLGIARALAERGAQVILHGRQAGTLEEARAGLHQPQRHHFIAADFSQDDGFRRVAQRVEEMGNRLDVLIHSAGLLGPRALLSHYPLEAWQAVMQVNLHAPFRLTQLLLPALRRGKSPSVLFISSGVGRRGLALWGAYAVSKFGVEGLTQVWAEELRAEGIRVNAVNPGGTRTSMRASAFPEEDPRKLPTPEDITPLFVYLSRPDVNVTGRSLEAREWIGRDPEQEPPVT